MSLKKKFISFLSFFDFLNFTLNSYKKEICCEKFFKWKMNEGDKVARNYQDYYN